MFEGTMKHALIINTRRIYNSANCVYEVRNLTDDGAYLRGDYRYYNFGSSMDDRVPCVDPDANEWTAGGLWPLKYFDRGLVLVVLYD